MITILDYKAGNQTSVKRALDYLGISNRISANPDDILSADHLIFPGVGHAQTAMSVLSERNLDSALRKAFNAGIPILGICLGSQIILSRSEEGDTACLDLIPGDAKRFQAQNSGLKIPHMGWNSVRFTRKHPLFKDIPDGSEFYYVHSFYPYPSDPRSIYALTDYLIEFPAIIGRRNLIAAQFHAEKSGKVGLQFLANFASWIPEDEDAQ
ncbi:MAG TPA: imidazole glycerol phosphate synthase subunit HisH [Anaerolineales bacterium]|nr:imidazole glycerol phosphate synthase subunit HisH [Anaerolineales bacterium]